MKIGGLILLSLVLMVGGTGCGDLTGPNEQITCTSDHQCGPFQVCVANGCKDVGDAYLPRCPDAGIRPDSLPLAQCPVDWIQVKAGSFQMGSPVSEKCRERMGDKQKETLHPVTLTRSFELAAYETSQGQFSLLMGYNPASFSACGAFCPVETVTWHEAAAYCNALSSLRGLPTCYDEGGSGAACPSGSGCPTGEACVKGACRALAATAYPGDKIYTCKGYRLPTEAEWEMAYRAGTQTALYSGPLQACVTDPAVQPLAWYAGNANGRTFPSCIKVPNKLGLHDLAGNVAEWVHDWYAPDLGSSAATDPTGSATLAANVVRGGDYKSHAHLQRAAFRRSWSPWLKGGHVGFRCARSR